jgi:anti-sigma B factor antagonist
MSSLAVEAEDRGERRLVLKVSGELDLAVADRLDSSLVEAGTGWRLIVVNLSGCEFIDSSGIASLLRARTRLAEAGCRLVLCCAADQVERLLEVTGLSSQDHFVFDNLEGALGSV